MWSRSEVWDYANEQADELGLDVLRFATTFWCDMQFGALIDALKMKGVYDDTLVILQSDHGQIAKGLVGTVLRTAQSAMSPRPSEST